MTGGFVLGAKQPTISSIGGNSTDPQGLASTLFYNETFKGEPRMDNLFAVRVLGRTYVVQMLKDVIKNQVKSTPFKIRVPEGVEPTPRHEEAAESLHRFLDGNFNTDFQPWDDLMSVLLDDLLDADSGVLELVPDEQGFLKQIIHKDGITFTKNPDKHGLLPLPDEEEPAFYQFSASSVAKQLFMRDRHGIDIFDLRDELGQFGHGLYKKKDIPFSRDQIVWFSESPVSYSSYGIGRTQKIKRAVEIVLNGDIHRNKYFLDNEFHKGLIQIVEGGQADVEKIQNVFDSSRGDNHTVPVIGGAEAQWISMDPTPDKMQFLESHKWYLKVVLMAYGLNEAELGNHENANLSVSDEMKFNIWRRTTSPLLKMFAGRFQRQILPFTREYHAVDGELEFVFDPESQFLRRMEQTMEEKDLELGVITPNDLRQKHGKDDFGEVGDLPSNVFNSLAEKFPGWMAEQINQDIEDAPSQAPAVFSINGEEYSTSGRDDEDDDYDGGDAATHEQSYKDFFLDDELTRDALRNSHEDFPHLKSHIDALSGDVGEIVQSVQDDILKAVEQRFPDEPSDTSLLVRVDDISDDISLDGLGDLLSERNLEALKTGAEHHEAKLEEELEKHYNLPLETKILLDFDLADTFAAQRIMQGALVAATTVEQSIKERVKNTLLKGAEKGLGVAEMSREISKTVDTMSREHSELVARTETLSASRAGSQALAEASPLIGGKEWLATNDNRTRSWHKAMDGQVVRKDKPFVVPSGWSGPPEYQPKDYPRSVFVVGDDQPYNCRCDQAPVLEEDLPDLRSLEDQGAVLKTDLTMRQIEVWQEHSHESERSFKEFWKRANNEMSVTQLVKEFGISKATAYNWND